MYRIIYKIISPTHKHGQLKIKCKTSSYFISETKATIKDIILKFGWVTDGFLMQKLFHLSTTYIASSLLINRNIMLKHTQN